MSPLALAVLNYLQAEAGWPPLRPDSISRGLWQTGAGLTVEPIPVTVIEGALAELMAAGQVERVFYPKSGEKWRAMADALSSSARVRAI